MRAAVVTAILFSFLAVPAFAQDAVPDYVQAAVADPGRPASDTRRDADRMPAQSVAFSRIKPGDRVVDFLPGEGYFTRIFSRIVGPRGHVYAVLPPDFVARYPRIRDAMTALAADPAYSNVTVEVKPYDAFGEPEKLDMVWTSLNYHDLHNPAYTVGDINAFNRRIFESLKPGGIYMIIDHAAAPGAGFTQTLSLHRADPEAVKREVEAAGFLLDGESGILRRASDDHTIPSGDARMRDRSDQFILRFRKPRGLLRPHRRG